jgi:hypothetical protein
MKEISNAFLACFCLVAIGACGSARAECKQKVEDDFIAGLLIQGSRAGSVPIAEQLSDREVDDFIILNYFLGLQNCEKYFP